MVEIAKCESHRLGRQIWITRSDGSRVDAEKWERYQSHRRSLERMTLEARIAYYASADLGRMNSEDRACIAIDQILRPWHLLEIDQRSTALLQFAPRTAENAEGRRLRGLLRSLRQRFGAGGERGFARRRAGGTRIATRKPARMQEAEALLKEMLADREVPTREVRAAARERGISGPTLYRASRRLGVRSRQVKRGWVQVLTSSNA